jgi:hypothetical protein
MAADLEAFAATWQPWGPKGPATPEAWREWCKVLEAMCNLPFAAWARCKKAADKTTKKKSTREKRVRDVIATMRTHATRIAESVSDADFALLDKKWLADITFDGAVPAATLGTSGDLEDLAARVSAQQAPAATVYAVAVAKGFRPLGIVSCRKDDEVGKQLAGEAVLVNKALPMRHMPQTVYGEIAKDVKWVAAAAAPAAAAAAAADADDASVASETNE